MRPTEVNAGEVIQNAVAFNFRNSGEEIMNAESLPESVERLFSLLYEREIEYLLVGGVAMLGYVEGRNTEDIDVILAASDLEKLPEIAVENRDADFARGTLERLRMNLLLTSNPLFEKVRRKHATTGRLVERDVPCATTTGLLLLKLYALPSLYRRRLSPCRTLRERRRHPDTGLRTRAGTAARRAVRPLKHVGPIRRA